MSKPRNPPQPPALERYEALWAAYRDGARAPSALARAVGASIHTARHAIRHGWPASHLAPLVARAELYDRQQTERSLAAIAPAAPSPTWEDAALKILAGLADQATAVDDLGRKVIDAVRFANFVKYRETPDLDDQGQQRRDAKGRALTVLKPIVDGPALTAALRLLVSASRELTEHRRALFATLDPAVRPLGPDLPELTQDQLDRIRRGEIPDDLAGGQLAAALLEAERLVG